MVAVSEHLRPSIGSWYRFHARNWVTIYVALLGTLVANLVVMASFGLTVAAVAWIPLSISYLAGLTVQRVD